MGKHAFIAPIVPRLVDEETAAAYLGRGRTRFRTQVKAGELPGPADRNGNVGLWDIRALDRYVDKRSGATSTLGDWDE
jgi:hypothetical protein